MRIYASRVSILREGGEEGREDVDRKRKGVR